MTEQEMTSIKEVFETQGAMSNRQWAKQCLEAGVWAGIDQSEILIQWGMNRVGKAVRMLNKKGALPWALPSGPGTKEEGPIWKQLDFLEYDELVWNIRERTKQIDGDIKEISRLCDYSMARFEMAPEDVMLRISQWGTK